MKRMKKVKLTNLHWEPVYIVPRQDGLPRRGWYLADDIGCGFDLYRGGCEYIAYEDIGTLYDVFVLDAFKLKALKEEITMEELKKQIIDMVNGLDNERWTNLIYYYVKHLTAHAKGGEKQE